MVLKSGHSSSSNGKATTMAQVIPIPWKDCSGSDGLGGVLEIRASDIPPGACIKDLIVLLNEAVPQPNDASETRRVIQFIDLYGNRLPHSRSVEALVPAMSGASPRLIATCRFARDLVIRQYQPFLVNIKTVTGKTIPINCEYEDTVMDVKRHLQDREGIPPDQQRLIFEGQQLEDDVPFVSYGVTHGATVYSTLRLRGGGSLPQIFADVSNGSLLIERAFSTSAQDWRKCRKGLNIEGLCENSGCRAFGKMVIQPNDFQEFNLSFDTMKCPTCDVGTKPLTCGFYDCTWKFEGVRTSDKCMMSSPWKNAFGEKYHRFDADSTNGTVQWDSLLIVASQKTTASGLVTVVSAASAGIVKAFNAEDESTCAVCWSSLRKASLEPSAITTTECGHQFHGKCIAEWATWCVRNKSLATCPICRAVMATTMHGA